MPVLLFSGFSVALRKIVLGAHKLSQAQQARHNHEWDKLQICPWSPLATRLALLADWSVDPYSRDFSIETQLAPSFQG